MTLHCRAASIGYGGLVQPGPNNWNDMANSFQNVMYTYVSTIYAYLFDYKLDADG